MIRIGEPEIEAVARIIRGGRLFRYPTWNPNDTTEVERFEAEWAEKLDVPYALSVTSGTAALVCALAGLGIGPGDEVIVPGYTFISSANAILLAGAIPVLAEVDDSLLLDPADVERRISPRTKAIMPVHMLGQPCDMDGIMAVARRHNIAVVEDACQADAGAYKGRRLGTIGDVGCFSFNYFKIMTAGEGGALVTRSADIFNRARMMQDGGIAFWPAKELGDLPLFVGSEFRYNPILAAILREQMQQVDGWLDALRAIKARLSAGVSDVVQFVPNHDPAGDCGIAWALRFDTEAETLRVQAALREEQVMLWRPFDTDRHVYTNWAPLIERRVLHHDGMNPYLHPANQGAQMAITPDLLPRTLDILKRTLVLSTMNPELPEAEQERIIAAVRTACAGVRA